MQGVQVNFGGVMMKLLIGICVGLSIGYFFYQLLNVLCWLVIGPLQGKHFQYLSFWGMEIIRENGRLNFRITNFSPNPEISFQESAQDFKKKLSGEGCIFVVGVAVLVCSILFVKVKDDFWNCIANGTMVVFGVFLLVHLCMLVKMAVHIYGNGPESVFWRESQRILELLQAGSRPKDLVFKYDEPGQDYFNKAGHQNYNLFRYYKALELGEMDMVSVMVKKMEQAVTPAAWSRWQTPLYYEILYYYSAICRDLPMAEQYADLIMEVMRQDKDINGRRVYAAYLYYTGKDKTFALQTARNGLEVMEQFPIKGQAFMERDLLEKMIQEIEYSM